MGSNSFAFPPNQLVYKMTSMVLDNNAINGHGLSDDGLIYIKHKINQSAWITYCEFYYVPSCPEWRLYQTLQSQHNASVTSSKDLEQKKNSAPTLYYFTTTSMINIKIFEYAWWDSRIRVCGYESINHSYNSILLNLSRTHTTKQILYV